MFLHVCVCSGGGGYAMVFGPGPFWGWGVPNSRVTGPVKSPVPGPARGDRGR